MHHSHPAKLPARLCINKHQNSGLTRVVGRVSSVTDKTIIDETGHSLSPSCSSALPKTVRHQKQTLAAIRDTLSPMIQPQPFPPCWSHPCLSPQ